MNDLQRELLSPRVEPKRLVRFSVLLTCEPERGRTQKDQRPNRMMSTKADHTIDVFFFNKCSVIVRFAKAENWCKLFCKEEKKQNNKKQPRLY